jgi:hypothetical protein
MPNFILRITLIGTSNPTVWRLVQVPGATTFQRLHRIIQRTLGWRDGHLHEFRVPGRPDFVITTAENVVEEEDREAVDEKTVKLNHYLHAAGDGLEYVYDFGDDWVHRITVVDIHSKWTVNKSNLLLGAEGNCPPEDVGGAPGFALFKAAIGDKQHPSHQMYKDWMRMTGVRDYNPWDAGLERKVIGLMAGI